MEKNSILEFNNKESLSVVLNELLRNGAKQLIHQAVETELREYLSHHQRLTDDGRIVLLRNGYPPKREILTGIGPVSGFAFSWFDIKAITNDKKFCKKMNSMHECAKNQSELTYSNSMPVVNWIVP